MINADDEVSLAYLISPTFQVENTEGRPLTGGYIEVYIHGTRTKYYCYSDWNGSLHPFKIPLDSLGSNIVLASPAHSYDLYIYNKYGTLVMSRYNIIPSTGDGAVIKDVVTIKSKDGTVTVDNTTLPNGVQYDLSVNTGIIATKKSVEDLESSLLSKQDVLTPGSNIDITNNIISATGIPTKTSELVNDSGFITSASGEWIDVPLTPLMPNYFYTEDKYMHLRINNTLRLGILTFAVRITNPNFGNDWVNIFSFEPFGRPMPEDEILQFRLFQQQDKPVPGTNSMYELYKWAYGSINPNKGKIQMIFVDGERSLDWIQPTSSYLFAF